LSRQEEGSSVQEVWAVMKAFLIENPGLPFWIVVLAVVALRTRSEYVEASRKVVGLCAHCGTRSPTHTVADLTSRIALCDGCARRTQRSHRVGFLFFTGMAALGLVLSVFGFVSDMRSGFGFSPIYLVIFGLCVGAPLVIALLIRRSSRPSR
jgi:hypothetical protein